MTQANDLKKLSQQAMKDQNPFGPWRAGYAEDLRALQSNPGSIVDRPGFQIGQIALDRRLAAQGYNPATTKIPGNYIDAQSTYGANFYNQELQRLMQLSGANFPPGSSQAGITGSMGAADLASKSLASAGYALGGSDSSKQLEEIKALLQRQGR